MKKRIRIVLIVITVIFILPVTGVFGFCLLDDLVLRPGDGQWELIVSDLAFHHMYSVRMANGVWSTGQSDRIIRLFPPGLDASFYDPSQPIGYRNWKRRIRWD